MSVSAARDPLEQKLIDINGWAMTLILGLVLEQASGSIVTAVGARNIDAQVLAALGMMALIFGMLLGTLVGILALHMRFGAPYRLWYVIVDIVLVTVPLFVAVKFIAASINGTSNTQLSLDENLFRIAATMVGVSFVFLFTRDLIVLPPLWNRRVRPQALIAVMVLHFLGAVLFFSLAAVPGFVVFVAVIGSIGLAFFFAGMVAIPTIERLFESASHPTLEEARTSP